MSAASVLSNMEKQMQKWLETEVGRLAKAYNFNKKEAMDYLNGEIDRVTEMPKTKKTQKDAVAAKKTTTQTAVEATETKTKTQTKTKAKTKTTTKIEDLPQPDIPLPFCKVGVQNQCVAVVLNHQLFTQCTHITAGELEQNGNTYSLCKACLKSAKTRVANGNKALTYGTIEERIANGGVYGNNGALRKPVPYANVLAKLSITEEQAQAAAQKMGWTIPEDELNPKPVQKGRPKRTKSVEVVADTSESDTEKKKKAGRPKKNKKVMSSAEGDDLISALVAKAKEDSGAEENGAEVSGAEENGPEMDSVQKATDELVKKQAAVMADLPKEEWKPTAKAARKKNETKKATKKEPSAPPVPAHDTEQVTQELQSEVVEEDEEETQVIKWKCPADKKEYLKAADGVLYDMETQDPVGVWNDETQEIDELPEEEDE